MQYAIFFQSYANAQTTQNNITIGEYLQFGIFTTESNVTASASIQSVSSFSFAVTSLGFGQTNSSGANEYF